jgi:mono/diheme cytochrome c family protein
VVIPPGASRELVALGERVYQGQVGAAACVGCHGAQGKGGPLGPNLTDRQWLWGDGSVASIKSIIRSGVATPKQYRGAMPPMGGAPLTEEQLEAVAAYLWSISQSADARPPVIPVPAPGARSSQRLLGVVADETAAINKY